LADPAKKPLAPLPDRRYCVVYSVEPVEPRHRRHRGIRVSNAGIVKLGKRLTIWLPDRIVREAKAKAEMEGRPTSRLVEAALRDYLRRQQREGRRA
jgi:hypothetical protein